MKLNFRYGSLVFYDVDTQNDFMNKDGALYVPEAETIKPALKKLTDFARKNRIAIMGSVDRHFGTEEYRAREGELKKWGGPFPDHCMDGTKGQEKIPETRNWSRNGTTPFFQDWDMYIEHDLIENEDSWRRVIEAISYMSHAYSGEKHFSGVFFEKQNYDVFSNPMIEKVLLDGHVGDAIVYGVATDFCVKAAVLGMQKRGIQTYVVKDAIKGVFPESTKSALEEMAAAGAKFVTTQDVLEARV